MIPVLGRYLHLRAMRSLWNSLHGKSRYGYIAHLQKGQEWDEAEFELVGSRFVQRMLDRFREYGSTELKGANVLEIGCGVGRFLKPLSAHFKSVCGVDISKEMLNTARARCERLPNVTFQLCDGKSLRGIQDGSFDYCVSAGVFQHITDFSIVAGYIREALRVLKPGGTFLFQFDGTRTGVEGSGQTGARITAACLDAALKSISFLIREVSIDPNDRVRSVVVVLQKSERKEFFRTFTMMERPWISGVYDDIKTLTFMHEKQKGPYQRLTFYDS